MLEADRCLISAWGVYTYSAQASRHGSPTAGSVQAGVLRSAASWPLNIPRLLYPSGSDGAELSFLSQPGL
eukprot:s7179_g2.t1